ncbi:MAG: tRNA (guanosine(46)-N7)-methyltransferase TrmB [Bacteroidales bacterium]|nr:tRNA (guanosine(46)-N7)-methyltransferase TrmB [Bacteroidales bacterium]
MGHDKLRKFEENKSFGCLVQPSTEDVLHKDHPLKGRWAADFFHNGNPIVLEIGCGKGEYTIALALRHPDINYIGIDIKGARLWKGAKYATENKMPNVGFLRTRVEFITSLFGPGEVSGIWITFADPQIRRENLRLTSPRFLSRYSSFLKDGAAINLKTDSRYLHEYTLALARQNSLKVLSRTADLYSGAPSDFPSIQDPEALFEVQTFYEQHFLAQGFKITFLSFSLEGKTEFVSPDWDEDSFINENHQAFAIGL